MESRPGLLFALFLLVGGAFVATRQQVLPQPDNASSAPAPDAAPVLSPAGTAGIVDYGCQSAPFSVEALCEKFAPPQRISPEKAKSRSEKAEKDPRDGGIPEGKPWVAKAQGKTHFLIAIVPDPELTRLSLYFDRSVESVQRAAETAGFLLDRHWLPWGKDSTGKKITTAVEEPGSLLFRRAGGEGSFLVVFLVGESPVSGIRQRQFLRAVQYAKALGNGPTYLVSGTSYSGALASLKTAIQDARALFASGHPMHFEVISGSATVRAEIEAFRNGASQGANVTRFHSVLQDDDFASEQFSRYLERRWAEPIRKALIAEGQTAYGIGLLREEKPARATEEQSPAVTQIRFPREIARLRGAYPHSNRTGAGSGASTLWGSPSGHAAQVDLPIEEVLEGRDSVMAFSGKQLPVAQESVLLEIAGTLRRERVALAGITATDVFDALFLAGFLRTATPGVRLYTDDADLLYVRAASQYAVDGVMAVSTYPLMTQNQYWSLGKRSTALAHRSSVSSRFELGMFNAARALLLRQKQPPNMEPPLHEHFFPGCGYEQRPPVWLMTVGINGYWPIAVLGDGRIDPNQLGWNPVGERTKLAELDLGWPGTLWVAVFSVLVGAGALFGSLATVAQFPDAVKKLRAWSGAQSELRESRLWRTFLLHPTEDGATGRAYFISAQCLALGAMLYPVASPFWALSLAGTDPGTMVQYVSPSHWHWYAGVCGALAFVLLMLGAVAPYVRLFQTHFPKPALPNDGSPPSEADPRPRLAQRNKKWSFPASQGPFGTKQYLYLAVATFVAYPFPLRYWWASLSEDGGHALFFFTLRSLDLLNGVSPATPFLLLGGGLFLMARLHARRHALALEAPRHVPDLKRDFQTLDLHQDVKRVSEALENPVGSEFGSTVLILIPPAALLVFVLLTLRGMQSLESAAYDWAYRITLFALFLFASISWARFLLVWWKLRNVLDALELHPLRGAFSVLPSGYAQLPVLEGSGTMDSRARLVRCAQDLRALAASPPFAPRDVLSERSLRDLENRIQSSIAEGPQAQAKVWSRISEIGSALVEPLEDKWLSGCGAVDEAIEKRSAVPENRRAYRIAEEIVATPYLAFLGNAMLQMRNLLFYVTTSFFLGVVSALVYPFRSVQMIVWAATAGLVVLGLPVVLAIVQMEHDEILRRLTRNNDEPGAFRLAKRLAVFGALPLLAMLGSYFPGIGRYLITVLEPALKAL